MKSHGKQIIRGTIPPDRVDAIDAPADGEVLTYDAATDRFEWVAGGGGGNSLLDGSAHTDTVAQAVTRGSLVYGNSTPAWDELAVGTNREVLTSDGTDAAWAPVAGMSLIQSGLASSAPLATLGSSFAANTSFDKFGLGVLLPGGWLTQYDQLTHRFTVEAYRTSGSGSVEIQLWDLTNSQQLAVLTGITAGSLTFYSTTSFAHLPSGDAVIIPRARYAFMSASCGFRAMSWFAQAA